MISIYFLPAYGDDYSCLEVIVKALLISHKPRGRVIHERRHRAHICVQRNVKWILQIAKQARACALTCEDLVARAGFEPAISALRGRCPKPLDERAICGAPQRKRYFTAYEDFAQEANSNCFG